MGFSGVSSGKESSFKAKGTGSDLERSAWKETATIPVTWLKNPYWGAWWVAVHGLQRFGH